MHVIVQGHHIHVSDHLREAAVHKLEKLSRFFDRITQIDVEFSHEKVPAPAKHRVEALLTTPLGAFRAHAHAPDPEAALDAVVDKLERQIKRKKDKVVHKPKGGIRAAMSSPRMAPLPTVPVEAIGANGSKLADATGDQEAAATPSMPRQTE